MSWAAKIKRLRTDVNPSRKVRKEISAIHSGKLGDIIYALPTVRALGINHLLINVGEATQESIYQTSYAQAMQLVPLLLTQTYIAKVSIVEADFPLSLLKSLPDGIDYLLDRFQTIDADSEIIPEFDVPNCVRSITKQPRHLAQISAAAQGIDVDLSLPWLKAPAGPTAEVLVSLTPRWRSYNDHFWKQLLWGLPNVELVGLPHELRQFPFENTEWFIAKDHLALAGKISNAKLFLGSVSFPYAIAEGLKSPRSVEVCRARPDAFPVGESGVCLPPHPIHARALVARLLALEEAHPYVDKTRYLKRNALRRLSLWTQGTRNRFSRGTGISLKSRRP